MQSTNPNLQSCGARKLSTIQGNKQRAENETCVFETKHSGGSAGSQMPDVRK